MRAWTDVWWSAANTPTFRGLASEAAKRFARDVLARYLGRAPTFARGPHGKPHVVGATDLHFNVSHAPGLSVIAVGNAEVGIDVESTVRPPRFLDGLRRYLPPPERDGDALAAWTRREALMKAVGTGVCREPAGVSATGWRFIELKLPDGYVGHVAAATGCRLRHAADFMAVRNGVDVGFVAAG